LAPLPNCTNTGLRWHVRWTGKCLNKSLKSQRAAGLRRRCLDGRKLGPAMAGGGVCAVRDQRGPFDPATLDSMRTAQMQMTARRRIDRARYVALQDRAVALGARTRHRDRGEQRLRIRMARVGEQLI